MDARLLPGADADGLPVGHEADGVGLGVLEGDPGQGEIADGGGRQVSFWR